MCHNSFKTVTNRSRTVKQEQVKQSTVHNNVITDDLCHNSFGRKLIWWWYKVKYDSLFCEIGDNMYYTVNTQIQITEKSFLGTYTTNIVWSKAH